MYRCRPAGARIYDLSPDMHTGFFRQTTTALPGMWLVHVVMKHDIGSIAQELLGTLHGVAPNITPKLLVTLASSIDNIVMDLLMNDPRVVR